MELRRLGQSELTVPTVVFGAWAIGGWNWGGTDDEDAIRAIHASIDAGAHAIDTAPMYGFGHSEEVVGRAIRDRRDRALVLTKVGLRWDDDRGQRFFETRGPSGESVTIYRNLRPDSIRVEVERSLRRLGIETIDLIQCHWPDATTPVEESMGALAQLVQEGKARAIGVSNFNVDLLQRSRVALGDHGLPLASTQPRYSLLDREIENNVLPWCRNNRVGAIVYSPLEQGLLTGKVTEDREFAEGDGRRDDPKFSRENRRRVLAALNTAREVAATHQCTLAQLAAAWCHHRAGVTAAIVGARDARQAEENARAGEVSLSREEFNLLANLFDEIELQDV